MKFAIHFLIPVLVLFFLSFSTSSLYAQSFPLKIAIYNDDGVGTYDPAAFEACLKDTNLYKYTEVSGADIRAGILNKGFDVALFPGGSGSGQAESLQDAGLDSVRNFVYRGGGYYGTCGGAYLASAAYSWSLKILNAKAVDAGHWARGHGYVVLNITKEGQKFYSFPQDTVTIMYYQGPLMAPGAVDTLPAYVKLSTFATEIAENGAIPGAMIGTTAFAQSCFGKGRVIIHSPHPEGTTGLGFMVRAAVNYAGNKSNFTKIATPLTADEWNAGKSKPIQWISGNGVDSMQIHYSIDNGATWTQISASAVNKYDWVIPNTPSTTCKLRINSLNRAGIGDTVSFVILPPLPTVASAASGNWSSAATWTGGVLPDSAHNVLISAGHTVTVDVPAYCNDISFGDANARLSMNANLYLYGNFNRYSTSANPFYATASLWKAGAKLVFTGSAAEQTITNLGSTSTSPYPFSMEEMVIDKAEGKFTTGFGGNVKIGIGTSLEIASGTFELGSSDDIEGRNVSGSPAYISFLIDSGAVFNMVGATSHMRRGNYTGEETSKIGKMTVFGEAYLATGSSNRINFQSIDIENGGTLYIPTSRGWSDSTFNPGTVTIKDGGLFKSSINTAYWYPNKTTPTTLVVNSGGEYYSTPTVINVPPVVTLNSGSTMRYYSTAASTLPTGITTYSNLVLTGTAPKSLGVNTTVNGTLTIQSSASLNLNSFALTYGPNATLQYGYSSQAAAQTTSDNEFPSAGGPPNLTIYNKYNVTLHSSRNINGVVKLTSGSLLTGSNVLQLGDTASVTGEKAGSYIVGNLTTSRTVGTGASTFGGVGVSIAAGTDDLGKVTVTRVSGTTGIVIINTKPGIARKWLVSSDNQPAHERSLTFSWNATDDNGKDLTKSQMYSSTDGNNWSNIGSPVDASTRSLTCSVNSFGQYTVNAPDLVDVRSDDKNLPKAFALSQNYPNPFNPATRIAYTLPAESHYTLELFAITGQRIATLESGIKAAGYYNYSLKMDSFGLASGIYLYRISASETTTGKQFTAIKKLMYLK